MMDKITNAEIISDNRVKLTFTHDGKEHQVTLDAKDLFDTQYDQRCPVCGGRLIWQCDYDIEDQMIDGIYSTWCCADCERIVQVYDAE